ncbi:hypothetical protein K2X30_06090 [bacterium]|nr:hypothetical protein [bacterium]
MSKSKLRLQIADSRAQGIQFNSLLKKWEKTLRPSDIEMLRDLAQDKKLKDTDRYIAFMGMVRLGGKKSAAWVRPFLKDSSWMMRSAALQGVAILGPEAAKGETSQEVFNLATKDPALVIRSQALETVAALKIPGTARVLLQSLEDKKNYNAGKPVLIPQKAIRVLSSLPVETVLQEGGPLTAERLKAVSKKYSANHRFRLDIARLVAKLKIPSKTSLNAKASKK